MIQGCLDHAHERVGLPGAGGRTQQDLVVVRVTAQYGRERGDGASSGLDVPAGRGVVMNRVVDRRGRRG